MLTDWDILFLMLTLGSLSAFVSHLGVCLILRGYE